MTVNMASNRGYADLLAFLGDVGLPLWDERTLANLKASGIGLAHLTSSLPFQDWPTTLDNHCRLRDELLAREGLFKLVLSDQDLAEAAASNRMAVILGLQEPGFVEDRLDRLERMYAEGLRIIQVAYQPRNLYGSGFLAWDNDPGLSALGREYIAAVDRAGLILDLSHLAPATALDCARNAPGPMMISHTGAQAVYAHHRGTTDDVLKVLAKREDTLVGIYAMTFFLGENGELFEKSSPNPSKTFKAGLAQQGKALAGRPALDQDALNLVAHIRHVAQILGPDKVAIGTDGPMGGFTDLSGAEKAFKEVMQPLLDPKGELGSRWPTHVPLLGQYIDGYARLGRLLEAHFSQAEVEAILGGNAWRFLERTLNRSSF